MAGSSSTKAPPSVRPRPKMLVGGAIVVAVLVGLVTWAMGREGSTAFYLTVSEVAQRGETAGERSPYRVNGTVVPGSIETRELQTDFEITDGSATIPVTTDSPMPDTFRDRSEVVALGRFDGTTFTASQVLAKCPSKFKAKA